MFTLWALLTAAAASMGQSTGWHVQRNIEHELKLSIQDAIKEAIKIRQNDNGLNIHDDSTAKTNSYSNQVTNAIYRDQTMERENRNTIKDDLTWPDAQIPYKLSEKFNEDEINFINESMEKIQLSTCVRFRSYNGEADYVELTKNESQPGLCFSDFVGRRGGKQSVMLNSGCFDGTTIVHELMHVMGFFHEHNRMDRDKFVYIDLDNVENKDDQFQFNQRTWAAELDLPYDYGSVMHYGSFAFSSNRFHEGYETIVPLLEGGFYDINYAKTNLSPLDIQKINKLYRCNESSILKSRDEYMKAKVYKIR